MRKSKTKNNNGFTLIELMITVAIVGILVTIAVPNFIAYRNKAKIAAALASADSIRAALASYAATQRDNYFPAASEITSWTDLKTICNDNGAKLKDTEAEQGMAFNTYSDFGTREDYYLVLNVKSVPPEVTGSQIEIRASGIMRQTSG